MNHFDELSRITDDLMNIDKYSFEYYQKPKAKSPKKSDITKIIEDMMALLFPTFFYNGSSSDFDHHSSIEELYEKIREQVTIALAFHEIFDIDVGEMAYSILAKLPTVKKMLIKDATATYEGDPAAISVAEVIMCYPGFFAIAVYRLAHVFYLLGIPYIPRMMTEIAHERTGIDIHAGATIGEYFCIDHGTGIVIGETAIIGERVKMYQGVTIGAKSFEVGIEGNPIKGIKRHPNIGNGCVIYANATILGANTNIGDNSVIGGNVWLTHSVPPESRIYYDKK